MYLGNQKIGCHSLCRSDDPSCTWKNGWVLHPDKGWRWTFLHFIV
jgi:hypothetical protein